MARFKRPAPTWMRACRRSTTQPLQDSVGKVGEGVKETIDNASDGDDRT